VKRERESVMREGRGLGGERPLSLSPSLPLSLSPSSLSLSLSPSLPLSLLSLSLPLSLYLQVVVKLVRHAVQDYGLDVL